MTGWKLEMMVEELKEFVSDTTKAIRPHHGESPPDRVPHGIKIESVI